ncbi:MAG: isoprenyl transferase [Armatimonadota bacterium]|nr:MAG: isoprenyl transferase [Armatimonadota bacterium]
MESHSSQASALPSYEELRTMVDDQRLPRHIAVIMDGNGRWAEERSLPRLAGHEAGTESVRAAIEECAELGIEALTLYTFSSENWVRPPREIEGLMRLIAERLQVELPELHGKNVRVQAIGRLETVPELLQETVAQAQRVTANNDGLRLNLAINYGGRAEIVDAARRVAEAVADGRLRGEDVSEEVFAGFLYAPELPDPDLLIRTAGEARVSNYLLWEIAYAEIVVLPTLWPDFRREHLLQAVVEYQRRTRKFGGLQDDLL